MLKERGYEPRRVRMAAVCSVCADPFVNHMAEFSKALAELGPSTEEVAA
jgi:coenzyme F420-reducing hydrogenase delta subunit